MANHTPGKLIARQFVSGSWQLVNDDTAEEVAIVKHGELARILAEAPAMLEELRYSADSPHDYGRYPQQHSDEQAKYCRTCRAIVILARIDGATRGKVTEIKDDQGRTVLEIEEV